MDLAVANQSSNTISVHLNTGAPQGVFVEPDATFRVADLNAYPNPITVDSRISFVLPTRSDIRLCIYDVAGRRVALLAWGWMAAGVHDARWNLRTDAGAKVGAGVFLLELRAGALREVIRMVVLE